MLRTVLYTCIFVVLYVFLRTAVDVVLINKAVILSKNYTVFAGIGLYTWGAILNCIDILVVFGLLSIGLYMMGVKIQTVELLRLCVLSSFVFLLHFVLKMLWFGFIDKNYTPDSLQQFYPFSLYRLLGGSVEAIETPLKMLNIFELTFWALLIVGIRKIYNWTWQKSIEIVLYSYISPLFFWWVLSSFIILSIS